MPKLSTYPTATLAQGDQLPIVDDPGGTPSTKLITASHALVNIQTGAGFDTPTQSGTPPTYTLTAADFGKVLVSNQSVTNYFTVPDGLPSNFYFYVYQAGTGSAVIQSNGTSSVLGVASSGDQLIATGAQKAVIEVRPYGTDAYVCFGSNLAIPPFANSWSVFLDDANSENVSFPSLTLGLSSSTNVSISFWFKSTGYNTYDTLIGHALNWYFLWYNSTQVRTRGWGADANHTVSTNLMDGSWHHICLVQDASNLNIHIDGGSSGSGETITHTSSSTPSTLHNGFHLGGDYTNRYCDGYFDELGFWTTALSGAEVNAIYNSGSPASLAVDSGNYASSADLVHWYRLGDGDSGTTAIDNIGGSSYNATLNNGANFAAEIPS